MPVAPEPPTVARPTADRLAPRGRGLGARLALLAAALLLVTMAAAGGVLMHAMSTALREEARSRGAALLGTLAVPTAMSLADHALERVDSYLEQAARVGGHELDILQVAMLDAAGHVVARTSPTRTGEPYRLDPHFLETAAAAPDALWREGTDARGRPVLEVAMPAVSGLRWGTLVAAFDLQQVEDRVAWSRKALILIALSFTAVIGGVLYVGLSRLVVRPVRSLATAAMALQDRQLSARADVRSQDELGRLSDAFNAMAAEIQSYTEGLERKVAERSAEVQRKNAELETVNQRLQRAVGELSRLARIDALTDVPNRRHFTEVIEDEVRRQTQATALVMIDVDHFKRLNDTFGHPVGDVVLRELAQVLGRGLRRQDVLARYGGEEFGAILPDTPVPTAVEVAERLRETVAAHDFEAACGAPVGRITVSLGVAASPSQAADWQSLIERADEALYAAKKAGRNRVMAWEPELGA